MKISLAVLYSQFDSRWANTLLGFNTDPKFNIYNYGCLVSCLAMLCQYFGKEETPATLNDKLKGVNGFVTGGNYVWGSITKIYKDITEVVTETPLPLTDAQINTIKQNIDEGYPVMCQIDYNPQTVKSDMHFVLIVGYNPAEENDFTIADPLGGAEVSLKKYLGWLKPSARKSIDRFICYKGPKPKITADMIPILKEHFTVFVHNDQQWHKLIAYLELGTDPNITPFEDVQRVIAGYKSNKTDLENRLNGKEEDLQKALTEIKNLEDKVANTIIDCQTQVDLKNAECKALAQNAANVNKLKEEYEGTLAGLRGDIREAQKEVGLRELEITGLKTQLNACKNGLPSETLMNKLFNLLKKIKKQ
jgi:hypothetical protein